MTSPFSVLSLSVSRHRKRRVHHVRKPFIRWRDWWPTTSSSTPRASAASIATPNSVWGPMQRCRGSSTANHTTSSSSRVKGTMMRASGASSTRSSGPPRMQRASPRRHNPQWFPKAPLPSLANDDAPLYTQPTSIHACFQTNKHTLISSTQAVDPGSSWYHNTITDIPQCDRVDLASLLFVGHFSIFNFFLIFLYIFFA